MIKSKKSLRLKNKLTGFADTEPSVSADFIEKTLNFENSIFMKTF